MKFIKQCFLWLIIALLIMLTKIQEFAKTAGTALLKTESKLTLPYFPYTALNGAENRFIRSVNSKPIPIPARISMVTARDIIVNNRGSTSNNTKYRLSVGIYLKDKYFLDKNQVIYGI